MGRFIAVVVVVLILVWFFLPKKENPYPRQTMVLVGSPMTVFSWNPRDRSLTLITIPEGMVAEGTHGYGTYSFEAFWKLGEIDKKDGTVLAESVSEALGIPIMGYIGGKNGLVGPNVFTFNNIISYLRGMFRTNVSLPTFVSFVWLLQLTKPERVTAYDFTHTPSLISEDATLPDGSHQLVLHGDQVDARLAHVFEDDRVRRETVTTAVYNTTDIQSLGTRVARLLGNLGVSVVVVANDTPVVSTCSVSGTKELLRSVSAKVIESVLGCVGREILQSERADLTVRIGKSYAKRFLPN